MVGWVKETDMEAILKRLFILCILLLSAAAARGADPIERTARPRPPAEDPSPLVYWSEVHQQPRPLRMFGVRVDLFSPQYEVVALLTPDPDGHGPAEGVLEKPLPIASRCGVLAAVNANAFGALPDAAGNRNRQWKQGMPVDIAGWAKSGGNQASPPERGYVSFWIEPQGRGRLDALEHPVEARESVAGFNALLRQGKLAVGKDEPLHPRTALGLDESGRWLWLVVVDGRQKEYSEGMTEYELATLMQELGCWDALNLDGGGSSVLIADTDGRGLKVVNSPSDWGMRPVPVMLGIRKRAKAGI